MMLDQLSAVCDDQRVQWPVFHTREEDATNSSSVSARQSKNTPDTLADTQPGALTLRSDLFNALPMICLSAELSNPGVAESQGSSDVSSGGSNVPIDLVLLG